MLEQYIICTLVLVMNTAVLWYALCRKLDNLEIEANNNLLRLLEQLQSVGDDLEITNENVLKLSDNVVEM